MRVIRKKRSDKAHETSEAGGKNVHNGRAHRLYALIYFRPLGPCPQDFFHQSIRVVGIVHKKYKVARLPKETSGVSTRDSVNQDENAS